MAWGWNNYGQLGNGSTSNSSVPVQANNIGPVVTVAGGGYHSLALKSDGTVWAWGSNSYGQLGNGGTTSSTVPVQVVNLTGVTRIAAGLYFSLALKSDGTVWAWGDNDYGQLGNGTAVSSNIPVQVSSLAGVTAIAAGYYRGIAVGPNGTVSSWGRGPLGDGSNYTSYAPVQASNLTGVTAVAGGSFFTLALKSDGTVWAWGDNGYGDLGTGDTTSAYVPVQVSVLAGVKSIAAGSYHGVALKNDGTVWDWGDNYQGQVGNSCSQTSCVTPVQVNNLSSTVAIAGGTYYSLALKSDSTVWAWGDDEYGQLGDGNTANSPSIVEVNNLNGVSSIAGGGGQSLAVTAPVPHTSLATSGQQTGCGSDESPVTVTLSATDWGGSNTITSTVYQVDGGSWQTYSAPFTITATGNHVINYYSTDSAGNVESQESTTVSVVVPLVGLGTTAGSYAQTISVNGSNFVAGEPVSVYLDSTSSSPLSGTTAGSGCSFGVGVAVPQATFGNHQVIAVGQTSQHKATALFQIQPSGTMTYPTSASGSIDSLTAYGFAAGETISLYWNSAMGTLLASKAANTVGTAGIKFTVPATASTGTYRVYAVGATSHAQTSVPVQLLAHNGWHTAAPLTTARTKAGVVTGPDGRIYAIGGSVGTGALSSVEAYSISTNTWSPVTSLPTALSSLAAVTAPNSAGTGKLIYTIGGYASGTSYGTVRAYNPATATWSTLASMPTARSGLGAAYVNGKIYAIGGRTTTAQLTTVQAYTPSTNTWVNEAPLLVAVAHPAVAVSGGKIYVIGGDNGTTFEKLVQVYDPSTNTWSKAASLGIGASGMGAAATSTGKIYATGGQTSTGILNLTQAYTTSTNSWSAVASMPTARYSLGAALGPDGKIYAIGGEATANSAMTTVEMYQP